MFTAANVFSIFWSLLLLFVQRLLKSSCRSGTVAGTVLTAAPQGNEKLSAGFDMQTELAKLAERIVEPVAAKLSMQELGNVVSQIKLAFSTPSALGLTRISKIWPLPSLGQFSRC
jgi:hypothetical protein